MQFRILRDTARPDLRAILGQAKRPEVLLRAIGVGVVSLTKQAFNDPAKRPNAWPVKADGEAATLKDTSTLWRSVRVVSADGTRVVVGSDRKYAAVHQMGSKAKRGAMGKIPRRAYLPFTNRGALTAEGQRMVQRTVNAWWRARGRAGG